MMNQAILTKVVKRWPLYGAAFSHTEPLFGRANYERLFVRCASDPDWLALSLSANAVVETQGAVKLLALATEYHSTGQIARSLQRHSLDELRHGNRVYRFLLQRFYPGSEYAELVKNDLAGLVQTYADASANALRKNSDSSDSSAEPGLDLLDYIIQISLGEIRTLINTTLLQRALILSRPSDRPEIERLFSVLVRDENRHIGYTAAILDHAARRGRREFIQETLKARLADLNEITRAEIGAD